MSARRFAVAAIGEPLYELNRQPGGNFLPGFGGDTLNVAIAAQRLGAPAAYVTRLGGDIFGDELKALMMREGIDTSNVLTDADAPTGLYFVTHGDRGHVFTYRRKDSAASRMQPEDIDSRLLAQCSFLHASGISQAISASAAAAVARAFRLAKTSGAAISYDTNFRPRLWSADAARPHVMAAAAEAHILKTSAEDAEALFGLKEPEEIARHFLMAGARSVVVTLGRDGVLLATPDGTRHIAGYAVDAVDATGAGDAFTGALIAECAAGRPLSEAARFANAAAALSTLGYGAIAPLPDRSAVEAFLGRQGR